MLRPASRGVSLIETCLVVAIVVTLTAIALPQMIEARQTFGLLAVAGQVRSELHRTRSLAIVRNQDCRLRVTSPVTYLIECQTPQWMSISFHQLDTGFTIAANNRPEFHPLGNAGPMGTITIWNERGANRRLIVGRSGRVRTE